MITGPGFTVIEIVPGVPTQDPFTGVTVNVAFIGFVPVFVVAKEGILPVPLAGNPMEGWLFTQLNVVFAGVPEKFRSGMLTPAQTE